MITNGLLSIQWHISWVAVITALMLIVFKIITGGSTPHGKNVLFYAGVFLLLLVTISPLAYLAHGYLFSAHMIEHIVLLLIVPPMLLVGTNAKLIQKLSVSGFRRTGNVLFSTPVAWIIGIGAMYIWHIPELFDAMKKSPALHTLHIITLLVAGIVFIWPVYSPVPWKRLSPLQSALYLFIACVGCTILGILITFSPPDLYIPYMAGHNAAVWNLVRNQWGITPAIDQQAGGLIMWVPACIIYITNIMLILAGYYRQPYEDDELLNNQ